jgi:hypothetical protein
MKARGRAQEDQQRKSTWLPPVRARKPVQRIHAPRVWVHNGIVVSEVTRHGAEFRWQSYLDVDKLWRVNAEWAYDLFDLDIELQGSCKTMDQAVAKSDAAASKVLAKFQKALGRVADRELKSLDAQKTDVAKVVRKYGATAAELKESKEFDAVVDGRSLYELDQAALEHLLVSVDWHLSRRGGKP